MLVVLLETGTLKELGRLLNVSGAFISQMTARGADRKKVPAQIIERLVSLLNERFSGIGIAETDFELEPAQFLALFPKDKIRYRAAASAGGIPITEIIDRNLQRLFGKFARFYMCSDPNILGKNMLAIDQFEFSPGKNADEALVTQVTNEFSGGEPVGFARLYGPSLFIQVSFTSSQYPLATFLSYFPQHEIVESFVTGSLDVKFRSSAVVARPMIFVRVEKFEEIALTFDHETEIYKASKKLFDSLVILNADKYELVPRSELLPEDLIEWSLAYKAIEGANP